MRYFTFIVFIFGAIILPSVSAQNHSNVRYRTTWGSVKGKAKIVEKGSTRYFKLGDQEYVCNVDNKISDASAKQILKTVRKIYSSYDTRKEHDAIIDSIWNTFHQVYTGEMYDQIMFECLKCKMNKLFEFIVSEKQYRNANKGDTKTTIYIPGIAHITVAYYRTKIRRFNDGSARIAKKDDYFDCYDVEHGYVRIDGLGTAVYAHRSSAMQSWEGYDRYNPRVSWRRISQCYDSQVLKIKKKPGNNFLSIFESVLKHYEYHCDADSFIYDSEWDQILLTSANAILAFRNDHLNGKRKSDFNKDAMELFSTNMMNLCLKFCKTDKIKKKLVELANKNRLKITVTKPRAKIKKKLF